MPPAGAVLTKTNLTKSLFPNPTQYKTARYPRILLTTEEMQEVKSVQPKGNECFKLSIFKINIFEQMNTDEGKGSEGKG